VRWAVRCDLRNRAPKTTLLPDSRLRIVKEFDVIPASPLKFTAAELLTEVWLPWGTQDDVEATCRLILQEISGQNGLPFETPTKEPPRLLRTYETLDATAETQVGKTDITIGQDNLVTAVNTSLQFTSATPIYGRIGVDTITAGTSTVILKSDERTDDGTLRTIKRTYISAGQISQDDQTKQNGSLLIRTIKSVYTEPASPGLTWARIDRNVDFISGLPVITSIFAQGNGEISRSYQGVQAGTTAFDTTPPITPTSGAIIETVKYLTPSNVTTDPTTTNLSQGVRFSIGHEDQDGYRIWTVSYGQGAGVVEQDTEYQNNRSLRIYHLTGFGAMPPAPAPQLGAGTSTILISTKVSNADGYDIFDCRYAEGYGQISSEKEYRVSVDQGANGLTITTIRFLTDPSVATNPITAGTTQVLCRVGYEDQAGYRLWTAVYGQGQGVIISEDIFRDGGALVIHSRTGLGSIPPTPSATIAGAACVLIKQENKRDRFHEGTIIYDYEWAEGYGEVSREVRITDGGTTTLNPAIDTNAAVNITTVRFLCPSSQTTPLPATLGVSTLVSAEKADAEGYRVWTTTWANGNTANAVDTTEYRHNGALVIHHRVGMGIVPSQPPYLTAGSTMFLISSETRKSNGYNIYDYRWAEGYGVIDDDPVPREGGLMEWRRSIVSPTTVITPFVPLAGGVLVRNDQRQEDGFVLTEAAWMYALISGTAVQSLPNGGTVLSFGIKHPFEYPGRAKPYAVTVPGLDSNGSPVSMVMVDVYKSPPVQVILDATAQINYQTSAALGALPYTFWNPTDWAVVQAHWEGNTGASSGFVLKARSKLYSLPGYRFVVTAGSSYLNFISGSVFPGGFPLSVFDEPVNPGSSGSVQITGGPSAPDGNTLVIGKPELEPAFYDIGNNVQWYRRTLIIATIPAQPALPV